MIYRCSDQLYPKGSFSTPLQICADWDNSGSSSGESTRPCIHPKGLKHGGSRNSFEGTSSILSDKASFGMPKIQVVTSSTSLPNNRMLKTLRALVIARAILNGRGHLSIYYRRKFPPTINSVGICVDFSIQNFIEGL